MELLLYILTAAVVALGLLTYRLIKSLEIYLIPLYAELIRKRERDQFLFEFLTSLLVSKGLITTAEAAFIKNMSTAGPVTVEDLDKIDEILDKEPSQLTVEEIFNLKNVAYKLLGRLDKRSVRLGIKLLKYAASVEESLAARKIPEHNTDRIEMSYDGDTCTVYINIYKKDGTIEKTQGPDVDCVMETVSTLKTLARRGEGVDKKTAEKALRRYETCKNSDAAGCAALQKTLGSLEKKSLDILLERQKE